MTAEPRQPELPLRVIFANQTGQVSGAERSLLELLRGLPPSISPLVAAPLGDLFDTVSSKGIPAFPIPGTDVSFRIHPVHTTKGVIWAARAGLRLRHLAGQLGADLIHANTTRAGLAAAVAARFGGPPAIVHVRDWVPPGWLSTAILRVIEVGASAIITNSQFISTELPWPPLVPVRVIHNPVDAARFDPERVDREAARANLGLESRDLVLAVVAQITPWKGQDDAVRILARLKPDHPQLRLLLAGSAKFTARSARFDNAAFERDLRRMVQDLGVERETFFLGERDDVSQVLRASDLLLVPSWKEAFGRIALEGMAMGVPVLAADAGGPAEIVRDGLDGILCPPRKPERWARAVDQLLAEPDLRRAMGQRGRERAIRDFTVERHVQQIVGLYDDVLESRRRGHPMRRKLRQAVSRG